MRPYMYVFMFKQSSGSTRVGRSLTEYYFGYCEKFKYSMIGQGVVVPTYMRH